MSRFIGMFTSVVMSCMLIFGEQWMHDFAFYVGLFFNCLSWCLVWAHMTKGLAEKTVVRWLWGIPSFSLYLYALASTGHPLLAASAFTVSMLSVAISYVVVKGEQP